MIGSQFGGDLQILYRLRELALHILHHTSAYPSIHPVGIEGQRLVIMDQRLFIALHLLETFADVTEGYRLRTVMLDRFAVTIYGRGEIAHEQQVAGLAEIC